MRERHILVFTLGVVKKQWGLHHDKAALASATVHWRVSANDHEPLDLASFPKFLLRR